MVWLILKTDARKESYVARQLQNQGFEAWSPVQVIPCRPAIARRIMAKTQLRSFREVAILPRRVFAYLEFRDWPTIRHMTGVETDSNGGLVQIPNEQIAAFQATIDAENTAAMALSTRAGRKQKAQWRSIHEALVEMINEGKQQMEEAA